MQSTQSLAPLPSPPLSETNSPNSPKSSIDALAALITSTYRTSDINFFVNGRPITVKNPNPDWVLLDWIRSEDNLKGTKLGCGEGGCGACTVVLQTAEQNKRVTHMAVNACLYPLIGVDGKSLITIEGLGTVNRPHPLQERIAKMQYVNPTIPVFKLLAIYFTTKYMQTGEKTLIVSVAPNVVSALLELL